MGREKGGEVIGRDEGSDEGGRRIMQDEMKAMEEEWKNQMEEEWKWKRKYKLSKYTMYIIHNVSTYVYSLDPSGEKDTEVVHLLESVVLCTMLRIPKKKKEERKKEKEKGKKRILKTRKRTIRRDIR